ncbi:unnamed protein product, partial [Owenia fusiformis]
GCVILLGSLEIGPGLGGWELVRHILTISHCLSASEVKPSKARSKASKLAEMRYLAKELKYYQLDPRFNAEKIRDETIRRFGRTKPELPSRLDIRDTLGIPTPDVVTSPPPRSTSDQGPRRLSLPQGGRRSSSPMARRPPKSPNRRMTVGPNQGQIFNPGQRRMSNAEAQQMLLPPGGLPKKGGLHASNSTSYRTSDGFKNIASKAMALSKVANVFKKMQGGEKSILGVSVSQQETRETSPSPSSPSSPSLSPKSPRSPQSPRKSSITESRESRSKQRARTLGTELLLLGGVKRLGDSGSPRMSVQSKLERMWEMGEQGTIGTK